MDQRIILGIVILGFIVLITIFYVRSRNTNETLITDTYSSSLNSNEEKIAFLGKYMPLSSDVDAVEFHITYHDNSQGLLPGPSDWVVEAIVKTSPLNTQQWTQGINPQQEQADISWGYSLIPENDPQWKTISKPQVYTYEGGNTQVAVFKQEGIVFKRFQSN